MLKTKASFPRMHVSLYVSNLAATINFYTSFFGKPAEKIEKGYAKYILDKPSLIISFVENAERVSANFGHLGFQVETPEQMAKHLEVAREKGIVQKEEIGTACCYAIQDKFWVADPDGVQWEVYYFHEDVAFNDPHYENGEASACCITPEVESEGKTEAKPKGKPEDKPKIKLAEINQCSPNSGCC